MRQAKWIITDQVYKGSMDEALDQWVNWSKREQARFVCFANVHMTVEAIEREEFGQILQRADMICADGQPSAPLADAPKLGRAEPDDAVAG